MAGVELPGFRFHPTEEELLDFYLKRVVFGNKLHYDIIGFLNIYRHDPWDLPGLAKIGEREWYFFVPRDTKHGHGGRPNRTTENGFWKATGSDRTIRCLTDPKKILGLRKTLVFYRGRAPHGSKTDWVMNEYRMPPNSTLPKEDIVLCKIYRKATSLKVLEQRAAMEEEEEEEEEMKSSSSHHVVSPSSSTVEISNNITVISNNEQNFMTSPEEVTIYMNTTEEQEQEQEQEMIKEEDETEVIVPMNNKEVVDYSFTKTSSLQRVGGLANDKLLPELQLPGNKINMDWMQDPFLTQSPWLGNWTPTYANLLLN